MCPGNVLYGKSTWQILLFYVWYPGYVVEKLNFEFENCGVVLGLSVYR